MGTPKQRRSVAISEGLLAEIRDIKPGQIITLPPDVDVHFTSAGDGMTSEDVAAVADGERAVYRLGELLRESKALDHRPIMPMAPRETAAKEHTSMCRLRFRHCRRCTCDVPQGVTVR